MNTPETDGLAFKTVLAANLHETKNILAQLMLRLDNMDSHTAAVRDARLLCQQVSDRMVQMLLLFELQAERLVPQYEAHNPADFLAELRENARSWVDGHLRIDSEEDGAPDYWYFDRSLVEMAMMNALHNAVRHASARLVLRTGVRNGRLLFEVEDDGAGYSASVLSAQQDEPLPVSQDGTGLGLYFSALIARAHVNKGQHGELLLHNGEAGGAVFSLLLP